MIWLFRIISSNKFVFFLNLGRAYIKLVEIHRNIINSSKMVYVIPRDDQLFVNIFMRNGRVADIRNYKTYAESAKELESAGYDYIFPAYCSRGIFYVLPTGMEYNANNFVPAETLGINL